LVNLLNWDRPSLPKAHTLQREQLFVHFILDAKPILQKSGVAGFPPTFENVGISPNILMNSVTHYEA
jgi:hypothetical protein